MGACLAAEYVEPSVPPGGDLLFLAAAKAGDVKKVRAFVQAYPIASLQTNYGVAAFLALCKSPPEAPSQEVTVEKTKKRWGSSKKKKAPAPYKRDDCINVVLDAGVDSNRRDQSGLTMLMYAAKIGDVALVQLFLSRKVNTEARSLGGWTALMHAATYLQVDAIRVMCEGVSLAQKDEADAEDEAGAEDEAEGKKADVFKARVDSQSDEHWTALALAVRTTMDPSDIKTLTEDSRDSTTSRDSRVVPKVYTASFQKARLAAVKTLLEAGANPNIADKTGLTPLMSACRTSDAKLVKVLLDFGAHLKNVQTNGNTCLHFAVKTGSVEVVQTLLDKHDDNFFSVLEAIQEKDHEEMEQQRKGRKASAEQQPQQPVDISAKLVEQHKIAENTADLIPISFQNSLGYSALHYCAYLASATHVDIARMLLDGVPPGRLPIDHNLLSGDKQQQAQSSSSPRTGGSAKVPAGKSAFALALENANASLLELIPPARKDQDALNLETVELKAGGLNSTTVKHGAALLDAAKGAGAGKGKDADVSAKPKYLEVRNSPSDPNVESDFFEYDRQRADAKANISLKKEKSHGKLGLLGEGLHDGVGSIAGGVLSGVGQVASGLGGGANDILHGNIFSGVKRIGQGVFHGVESAGMGLVTGVGSIGAGVVSSGLDLGEDFLEVSKFTEKTFREKLHLSAYAADVPDTARTYSSIWDRCAVGAGYGRSRMESEQCWSAFTCDLKQWVIMDLGAEMPIKGVVTAGRKDFNQWVTLFKVQISHDNKVFVDIEDGNEFVGNSDRNSLVYTYFAEIVTARYLRIKPLKWEKHISLRCDVLLRAEGLKPESSRTYSSVWDLHLGDTSYCQSEIDSPRCWAALSNDNKQWATIDCGMKTMIKGVVTRGRADNKQWVEQFTVQYSKSDPNKFLNVDDGISFDGNKDRANKLFTPFAAPVLARYIRIKPKGWHDHISLRWDYLMDATPVPPAVADPKVVANAEATAAAAAKLKDHVLSQPKPLAFSPAPSASPSFSSIHETNSVTGLDASAVGFLDAHHAADVRAAAASELLSRDSFESSVHMPTEVDDNSAHAGASSPHSAEATAARLALELAKAEREQSRRLNTRDPTTGKAKSAKGAPFASSSVTVDSNMDVTPLEAIRLAEAEQQNRVVQQAAAVKQLQVAPPVHHGIMFKKGDWFGEMKKRVFVLEKAEMTYYANEESTYPFGSSKKGSFPVNEHLRLFTKIKPEDGTSVGELDLQRYLSLASGAGTQDQSVRPPSAATSAPPRRRSIVGADKSGSDLQEDSLLVVRLDTGDRDIFKCVSAIEVHTWVEHIQRHLDWYLTMKHEAELSSKLAPP